MNNDLDDLTDQNPMAIVISSSLRALLNDNEITSSEAQDLFVDVMISFSNISTEDAKNMCKSYLPMVDYFCDGHPAQTREETNPQQRC